MTEQPRLLLSMGTRPEIIKMAPIYLELKKRGKNPLLLHTGQHTDMAAALYTLFGIVPDYTIDLEHYFIRNKETCGAQQLSELSGALMSKCAAVLSEAAPTAVLVHGDTCSALIMAMTAFYYKCTIGHVEAGLRSHNAFHPFPEEKNRTLIAQLASAHFAPTEQARANLLREGVPDANIHLVGNTIVEATRLGAGLCEKIYHDELRGIRENFEGKRVVLVTAHRRENLEHGIAAITHSAMRLLEQDKNMVIVWPVHPNPQIKKEIEATMAKYPSTAAARLLLTPPLSYPSLLCILKRTWLVLTDSGGIQEEASVLNVPVLVLRKTTERQELIEAGVARLVGTEPDVIVSTVSELMNSEKSYARMREPQHLYGDGKAVNSICTILSGNGYV